jgi:hypothetical protein
MNNVTVANALMRCRNELLELRDFIHNLSLGDKIILYLARYAVIRACGTIEFSYKNIIADFCESRSIIQIRNFLSKNIRSSPSNPSYSNICSMLKQFDDSWLSQFKQSINNDANKERLQTSLQSLVDARNEFAHGGNPHVSIDDIIDYFDDSQQILSYIDQIVR